ncbi:hypothetical protein CFK37_16600 [Virgibacillus phasianinus]|uniref:Transcriptional regulator n=1 Tax=Virgibacillus phasianinus TaxID=2017483 RepID=A0A220U738_9BACI|nr:sugar diacid recognition domain-containing protein [Virgibacillus phasianinus]ASK63661.1 hypothetical protein CFK37_16600 [Virgibacillus phasianinus]
MGIAIEELVQFAQKVVKAITKILPFSISLSDKQGYIIGDTNQSRIGTLHTPSIEVIKKDKIILYSKVKVSTMDNVLPGVAVPLYFNYKIVGVLGIIGDPDEVEPYAILVKKYVELMWQETHQLKVKEMKGRAVESFLQYVLVNKEISYTRLNHFISYLGFEDNINWGCIVIDVGDSLMENMEHNKLTLFLDQIKASLINCTKLTFGKNDNAICGFLTIEKMILLLPIKDNGEYRRLMDEFHSKSSHLMDLFNSYDVSDCKITAGSMYYEMKDIKRAYQEAEELRKFVGKSRTCPAIVTYYDWDILFKLLPNAISTDVQSILFNRLKPLYQNKAFVALTTDFMTYCESGMNISKAAKKLYIHRNTLIYRLKKMESLTKLRTNNFEHCTMLYFILKHLNPESVSYK